MAKQLTSDGTKGGLLVGKTDKDNGVGISASVAGGRDVILGGGEVIINEAAAKKHCKALNEINQSTGGRAIDCEAQKTANTGRFDNGGSVPDPNDPSTDPTNENDLPENYVNDVCIVETVNLINDLKYIKDYFVTNKRLIIIFNTPIADGDIDKIDSILSTFTGCHETLADTAILNTKDKSLQSVIIPLVSTEVTEHKFSKGGDLKTELERGIEVEQEHKETLSRLYSGDINVDEAIKETALDHIKQYENYYTTLAEIEPDLTIELGEPQLSIGLRAEEEHRSTFELVSARMIDINEAIKRIALDHLEENPKYYSLLMGDEKALHPRYEKGGEISDKKFTSTSDMILNNLKQSYSETPENIMSQETVDLKRQTLINWIKNTDNKVKIIIAFSGGKDSVAMVLYCLYDLNIPPDRIQLHHHEVDGHGDNLWDWKCTTSYCEAFAKHFNLELLYSYREGGITREIFRNSESGQDILYQQEQGGVFHRLSTDKEKNISTKLKFPAVAADLKVRWCSAKVKIEVMDKVLNNNPEYNKAGEVVNICVMTGERRSESTARSKYEEIERYRKKPTFVKNRKVIVWRSVINLTDNEVWDLLKKHKVQPHPSYELGWSRCSCQTCIFNSANVWASLNEISPEKVKKINDIENELNFTLYAKKAGKKHFDKTGVQYIMEDIYSARVDKGESFITDENKKWIDQANGDFTMPIIVSGEWILPQGAKSKENAGAL